MKKMDWDDMLTSTDIAYMFGITTTAIMKRITKKQLPEPRLKMPRRNYWSRKEVVDFCRKNDIFIPNA
jgi:hypothetical protein